MSHYSKEIRFDLAWEPSPSIVHSIFPKPNEITLEVQGVQREFIIDSITELPDPDNPDGCLMEMKLTAK